LVHHGSQWEGLFPVFIFLFQTVFYSFLLAQKRTKKGTPNSPVLRHHSPSAVQGGIAETRFAQTCCNALRLAQLPARSGLDEENKIKTLKPQGSKVIRDEPFFVHCKISRLLNHQFL
jgi:hypothetical protein